MTIIICAGCGAEREPERSDVAAELAARQAGWSTARSLFLCPTCTAAHNAKAAP